MKLIPILMACLLVGLVSLVNAQDSLIPAQTMRLEGGGDKVYLTATDQAPEGKMNLSIQTTPNSGKKKTTIKATALVAFDEEIEKMRIARESNSQVPLIKFDQSSTKVGKYEIKTTQSRFEGNLISETVTISYQLNGISPESTKDARVAYANFEIK